MIGVNQIGTSRLGDIEIVLERFGYAFRFVDPNKIDGTYPSEYHLMPNISWKETNRLNTENYYVWALPDNLGDKTEKIAIDFYNAGYDGSSTYVSFTPLGDENQT